MEDFITVTVVTAKLKKEVKDKFVELSAKANNPEPRKDSFGRNAQFYEELGVELPEDLVEDDIPQTMEIKKEDYDIIEKVGKVKPSVITFVVDNEDFGSTLYIDTDFTITVKETAEEIENKIKLVKDGVR
jgi:hypothetical protein